MKYSDLEKELSTIINNGSIHVKELNSLITEYILSKVCQSIELDALRVSETSTEVTGISLDELKSETRTQKVVFARWLCFYQLYKLGYSLVQIAVFYNRTHASVIHGNNMILHDIVYDEEKGIFFKEFTNKIEKICF